MRYLNYSKQNETNPDCIPSTRFGMNEFSQYSGYFHFISKQEITLLKQQLIDINFGLSFELDNNCAFMLISLHPSLANKGVVLPGGSVIVPYRHRDPIEIKLISLIEDVVIKPNEVILHSITMNQVYEVKDTVLRKKLNSLDKKDVYNPDYPEVYSEALETQDERQKQSNTIINAITSWANGVRDEELLKLYPEGHDIYKGVEFGSSLNLENEPQST